MKNSKQSKSDIKENKADSESNKKGSATATEDRNEELKELFVDELCDIYDSEKQLTKALPKMAKAAQDETLKEAFESHLKETEGHIDRLEQVFVLLGEKMKKKACKATQGLVAEAQEIMEEQEGTSVIDAALIAAGQKVEHYEIASYGTVVAWATELGETEAADLLEETLEEEKAADEKLTEIAETVNQGE